MVFWAPCCPTITSVRIPFGAWAAVGSMRASILVDPEPLSDACGKLLAETRAREARTSGRTPPKARRAHWHLPKWPNLYLDPEGKQKKSPKPVKISIKAMFLNILGGSSMYITTWQELSAQLIKESEKEDLSI